jgi:hypothetical protein
MRLSSECVYDQKRQKPGLKTGAIESINRRLELLESRLDNLGNQRPAQVPAIDATDVRQYASSVLSSLATHLSGLPAPQVTAASDTSFSHAAYSNNVTSGSTVEAADEATQRAAKRRRIDVDDDPALATDLPLQNVLDAVINKYFATAHHWVW